MPDLKTYTLEEAAQVLKLTRRTLYTYVKNGELQAVKFGRRWRVLEEDLKRFMMTGTTKA